MKRKNEGITLVALIITIIVLIILAGVTISMVVGDDGIITKAKEAKQNMSNATAEEEELLQNMLNAMNEIESGIGGGADSGETDPTPDGEKFSEIKKKNETVESNGKTAVVPKGFAVGVSDGINTIDGGLVITDSVDKWGNSTGNQFVWIPVNVEETDTETDIKGFKRTKTYDGTITDPGVNFTEPYSEITSADETREKAEYAEMYKSVYHNKGFYVGRYEAGCEVERTDSNKATDESQGEANPVLVQKNKYVYNYVPWGARMTSTAPASGVIGAVELSRGMYPKTSEEYGVSSGLMYGVQWDAVMTFVNDAEHDVTNDSSSWGNYDNYTGEGPYEQGKLQKTGINENWKVKNMYDLAGNAFEWTNEAHNIPDLRVYRGGNSFGSGSTFPASYRSYNNPDYANADNMTFRPMLYVNLNII